MKIYLLRLLVAIFLQFTIGIVSAQDKCDVANLSAVDTKILNDFWNNFKSVLNARDTQKLADICTFPFKTNYTRKVKKSDLKKIAEIFFSGELLLKVNSVKSFENLLFVHGNFDEKHRSCSYDFFYGETGKEIHFNLTRIDNEYKFISSWRM